MDVPIVAIGGVVFGFVQDTLGRVVEIAMQFQEVAIARGDGAEKRIG